MMRQCPIPKDNQRTLHGFWLQYLSRNQKYLNPKRCLLSLLPWSGQQINSVSNFDAAKNMLALSSTNLFKTSSGTIPDSTLGTNNVEGVSK